MNQIYEDGLVQMPSIMFQMVIFLQKISTFTENIFYVCDIS